MADQTCPLQPEELAAVVGVVAGVVGRLVPGEVPLVSVAGMFAAADQLERLGAAVKALLMVRLDDSGVWRQQGYRNVAEYVAAVSGCTSTAARARVVTARRLRDLPVTARALGLGRLSVTQVEHVADAARVNPGAEGLLLGLVGSGASVGELRDECGRRKAAGDGDPDKTWARLRAGRCLRQYCDTEGAWRFSGCGTVDDQAQVNAALDDIIEDLFTQARAAGRRIDRNQLAYDALVELARRHLNPEQPHHAGGAGGAGEPDRTDQPPEPDKAAEPDRPGEPGAGGEDEPVGTAATPTDTTETTETTEAAEIAEAGGQEGSSPLGRGGGRLRRRRRSQQTGYLGIIRADIGALWRGYVEGDELVDIAGLGSIPVERAKQLLGEAVLKLVITKGQHVATVVHLGRAPNTAQRTALGWLMPCCSVRGCARTSIQYDHRTPWAHCQQTLLSNLDPLCGFHHARKTLDNWALVDGTGKRAMVPPSDPRHPRHEDLTNRPEPPGPDPTSGPPGDGQPGTADTLLHNSIDTQALATSG